MSTDTLCGLLLVLPNINCVVVLRLAKWFLFESCSVNLVLFVVFKISTKSKNVGVRIVKLTIACFVSWCQTKGILILDFDFCYFVILAKEVWAKFNFGTGFSGKYPTMTGKLNLPHELDRGEFWAETWSKQSRLSPELKLLISLQAMQM